MGYIRHHAIVVTSWNDKAVALAHAKAREIFGDDVTALHQSRINVYQSFFVGPDGSKEGWEESDHGDDRRDQFVEWLNTQRYVDGSSALKWAVVQYGDDGGEACIDRHTDEPRTIDAVARTSE